MRCGLRCGRGPGARGLAPGVRWPRRPAAQRLPGAQRPRRGPGSLLHASESRCFRGPVAPNQWQHLRRGVGARARPAPPASAPARSAGCVFPQGPARPARAARQVAYRAEPAGYSYSLDHLEDWVMSPANADADEAAAGTEAA